MIIKESYSEFVFDHLKFLSEEIAKGKKIDVKLRYLIYLDYMIKFYSFNKIENKSPEDISRILGINLFFINILFDIFDVENFILFLPPHSERLSLRPFFGDPVKL